MCAVNESNATVHNNIAWLCAVTHRRLDNGLKHAQRAVELKPDSPVFLDTLAEVQFQGGQRQKAIEMIKKAIQLSPDQYFKAQLKRFEAADTSAPIP
jgi:predicted Zn-dependent protease